MINKRIWYGAISTWLLICTIFTYWSATILINDLKTELNTDAQSLHRMVSQRADQHDAHLTGLSSLASVNKEPLLDPLASLADTIQQFYTRITFIDLVKLDKQKPRGIFTSRPSGLEQNIIEDINAAAYASSGALQILPAPKGYLLVKRSPNSDLARYGVALSIDAAKLLQNDLGFGSEISIALATNDGVPLYHKIGEPREGLFPFALKFHQVLGSRSQPLILDVRRTVTLSDIVPWILVLPFFLLSGATLFGVRAYLEQRLKAKRSEQRALLGEHEARIAQASRINSLGEMASGLAHELTQPLTAILSKSQAGEHIVKLNPEDSETLSSVLSSITQQSKRAGDILLRLRKWTVQETEGLEQVDLNSVARGIKELMKADLKERGIEMQLFLNPEALFIWADAVQIEQVVFNLAKNGVEALDHVEGETEKGHTLEISTFTSGDQAVIEITDNGPGISKDIISNVHQPFFTTKPNGMGLGLSLCEGIVDRFYGTLEINNRSSGGVLASVTFPLKTQSTNQ
ncbi:sensor histidine kinase [Kiloniella sp.]|uniref:sensor histidine kinase n=1 Tax=Kiloniella sp. TaxID=1938587 RepID=UPI003B02CB9E